MCHVFNRNVDKHILPLTDEKQDNLELSSPYAESRPSFKELHSNIEVTWLIQPTQLSSCKKCNSSRKFYFFIMNNSYLTVRGLFCIKGGISRNIKVWRVKILIDSNSLKLPRLSLVYFTFPWINWRQHHSMMVEMELSVRTSFYNFFEVFWAFHLQRIRQRDRNEHIAQISDMKKCTDYGDELGWLVQ